MIPSSLIALRPASVGRRRSPLSSPFAGLVLATCLLPAAAHAGLMLDLRAVSVLGGGVASLDAKTVKLDATAGPGTVITLELWAVVRGTDGIVNENLTSIYQGSLLSSPGTAPNVDTGVAGNAGVANFPTTNLIKGNLNNALLALWHGGAVARDGTPADLDGDGDLDVGSTLTTPNTAFIAADTGAGPQSGGPPNDFHELSDGREFKISNVTFTVQSIAGIDPIALNYMFATGTAPGQATRAVFQSDGQVLNGADANLSIGAPVTVQAVPEPSCAALLLAGCGLLGVRLRRRE